jgi:hypothetical protein
LKLTSAPSKEELHMRPLHLIRRDEVKTSLAPHEPALAA